MEVSGKHHTPAALTPGKEPPVLDRRLGGHQSRMGRGGKVKRIPASAEIETRSSNP